MAPNIQTQAGDEGGSTLSTTEGVTIHHLNRDAFESDRAFATAHTEITFGDKDVTRELVDAQYEPAETVVGTTDLDEAFRRAQGRVVNQEQDGRHGVPSASSGDVFEVVESDGSRSFYLVESVGFSEVK